MDLLMITDLSHQGFWETDMNRYEIRQRYTKTEMIEDGKVQTRIVIAEQSDYDVQVTGNVFFSFVHVCRTSE